MSEQTEVTRLKAGMVRVEVATTKIGTAATAIQSGVSALLQKIKDNPDSTEEIKGIADEADTLLSNLEPLSEVLDKMGKDLNNPVPVEPPVVPAP